MSEVSVAIGTITLWVRRSHSGRIGSMAALRQKRTFPLAAIDADQRIIAQSPYKQHMENKSDLTAVAYKIIAALGDQAPERLDSIVADHVAARDAEGSAFWGEVASTVRRLQAGISITVEHGSKNYG